MRCIAPILCLWLAAAALAQPPAVTSTFPSAVRPGQTTDVTFEGSGLANPNALWTSFGATASFADAAGGLASCRVTVPGDVPVGIGAVRVATRGGVSNLRLFMVDDLPTVRQKGGNTSPAAAQAIAAPAAVEGACQPLLSDYYRIKAARGQRVSAEVVATRLGSALDPVLRLLDASGRELVYCDGGAGAGGDCRFAHTFAADGEYLLEVRDVGYDGGAAYTYRLRVGDFPLAVVPFPLGAKRGSAALLTLLGDGCEGLTPALAIPGPSARAVGVSARRSAAGGSGFAIAAASEVDETVEAEPNDTPQSATPLAFPAAVSGRFETPGDADFYKLALRKGERVQFRARSRTLGSPCDVSLRLQTADGEMIASSKVEGPSDPVFDATPPADGGYWLRAEELTRAGGAALAYRVEIDRYRPGFSLSVDADKVDARPGGEFQLKVTCSRRDFAGPITLTLDGLQPAALEGAVIPAGKQETQLKVKLAGDLKPGGIVRFGVVGTATVGADNVTAVASTVPALRKLFPRLVFPPDALDGTIALGVVAAP